MGSEQDAEAGAEALEEVLDALASLLRTLGEKGFDTPDLGEEESRLRFEAWARHVLVGAEPPGGAAAPADGGRDWRGLLRFTGERRRDESTYVKQSLQDFRDALWGFIQGISRAVPDERGTDETITNRLSELRESLDSSDTAVIRRAAADTVEAIETAIRERSARSRARIETLSRHVDQVAQELVEAREQLERDPLTKVYNRGALDEFLEKLAGLGMLSGQTSTLFLIDVDDFKWVNDRFGHPIGDAVLQEVASILGGSFGRRGDFVARYGGDEFAVAVQTESAEVDRERAETCLFRVRDLEIPHDEDQVRVTLSIGAARLDPGERADEWLERADRALYRAKEEGRDRFAAAEGEGG